LNLLKAIATCDLLLGRCGLPPSLNPAAMKSLAKRRRRSSCRDASPPLPRAPILFQKSKIPMTLRVRLVPHDNERFVGRRREFFRRQRENERVRIAIFELAYLVHLGADLEHHRRIDHWERARAVHFDLDAGLAAQSLCRVDVVDDESVALTHVQVELGCHERNHDRHEQHQNNQSSFHAAPPVDCILFTVLLSHCSLTTAFS
jgi:hypothetical protein